MSNEKTVDEESFRQVETASEINLNSNVEARIKNPLAGIPRAQLLRNVEIFAQEKQLTEELPILSKGAIRESSPVDFNRVRVLTRLEQSPKVPLSLKRLTYLTIVTEILSVMNTLTGGATHGRST